MDIFQTIQNAWLRPDARPKLAHRAITLQQNSGNKKRLLKDLINAVKWRDLFAASQLLRQVLQCLLDPGQPEPFTDEELDVLDALLTSELAEAMAQLVDRGIATRQMFAVLGVMRAVTDTALVSRTFLGVLEQDWRILRWLEGLGVNPLVGWLPQEVSCCLEVLYALLEDGGAERPQTGQGAALQEELQRRLAPGGQLERLPSWAFSYAPHWQAQVQVVLWHTLLHVDPQVLEASSDRHCWMLQLRKAVLDAVDITTKVPPTQFDGVKHLPEERLEMVAAGLQLLQHCGLHHRRTTVRIAVMVLMQMSAGTGGDWHQLGSPPQRKGSLWTALWQLSVELMEAAPQGMLRSVVRELQDQYPTIKECRPHLETCSPVQALLTAIFLYDADSDMQDSAERVLVGKANLDTALGAARVLLALIGWEGGDGNPYSLPHTLGWVEVGMMQALPMQAEARGMLSLLGFMLKARTVIADAMGLKKSDVELGGMMRLQQILLVLFEPGGSCSPAGGRLPE